MKPLQPGSHYTGLGYLVVLLLFCGAVQAQTAPITPSWAHAVDDASGRQTVAEAVVPAQSPRPLVPTQSPAPAPAYASMAPARAALPTPLPPVDRAVSGYHPARPPSAVTMPLRRTAVVLPTPMPVRVVEPSETSYVIKAGVMLSTGLADYVKRFGWSIRWNIQDDYRLDAPLPIPPGSVTDGVTFVIRTYQSQGGLLGDVPLFAKPNRVVVIQPTAVREK